MILSDTNLLQTGLESLKDDVNLLREEVKANDAEVSALMSIVIQTNKDVSTNLVKLTEVMSDTKALEKTTEEQQRVIDHLQEDTAQNKLDIQLSIQNSANIKDTVEEIRDNQKSFYAWGAKIFGSIIVVAIIGGIVFAKT